MRRMCAQVKIKGSNKISFLEFEESLPMVAEKKARTRMLLMPCPQLLLALLHGHMSCFGFHECMSSSLSNVRMHPSAGHQR
jgi:hypothetical protein